MKSPLELFSSFLDHLKYNEDVTRKDNVRITQEKNIDTNITDWRENSEEKEHEKLSQDSMLLPVEIIWETVEITPSQIQWEKHPVLIKNISINNTKHTLVRLGTLINGPYVGYELRFDMINGGLDTPPSFLFLYKDDDFKPQVIVLTQNTGLVLSQSSPNIPAYITEGISSFFMHDAKKPQVLFFAPKVEVTQFRYANNVTLEMQDKKIYAVKPETFGLELNDAFKDTADQNEHLIKIDGAIHPIYGQAWTSKKIQKGESHASNRFDSGYIFFRGVAGSWWGYAVQPDITQARKNNQLVASGTPLAITWNDGKRNTDYYAYSIGGCGSVSFNSGVDYKSVTTRLESKDLLKVGMTDSGLDVFVPSSVQNVLIREYYDEYLKIADAPYIKQEIKKRFGKEKLSLQEFYHLRPIVIFTDVLGRQHIMRNLLFAPATECGKPVIYLYPEKPMDITVRVMPDGGFSVTDPLYSHNGWHVHVMPNGTITNLADNKQYPYLFWEGYSSVPYTQAREGFVVARDELTAFFIHTLAQQSLTPREYQDFIDFWVPKMQENPAPYFFVTFIPADAYINLAAPLAVYPKPDTIIRIMMDYMPLQSRMAMGNVKPQALPHKDRKGFTVVEWGGMLGK